MKLKNNLKKGDQLEKKEKNSKKEKKNLRRISLGINRKTKRY